MDSDGGRRKSAKRALQIEKKDEITETPVPRNETKEGAALSTYELERNLRVAENHEMLQSLGIEPRAVQHGQRKRVRNSITSEFHQDGPRTRSRSDPGAPGAAAHQEQQRSGRSRIVLELSDVHNMTEHGVHWWPAAVSAISPLAVVWDDPQGCEPVYCPSSCQFIRVRLFCGCGSCTADVLSDRALDEHQKKVALDSLHHQI